MTIKYRGTSYGYLVQCNGKEYGCIDKKGCGLFGTPFWIITKVRKEHITEPWWREHTYKTRKQAAEALIANQKDTP